MMEAGAAVLDDSRLEDELESLELAEGETARSGQRAVMIALAGIVVAGAALRFSTLGVQSYHHDEIITVARVIPAGLGHTLHEVNVSESTPPLYYLLAWVWARIFGVSEVGMRSLSAIFGLALIPLAYLIGKELHRQRTGLILAALVAVNPMLIWYSQEARAYSLMVLLSAAGLYFFIRALRTHSRSDLAGWAICSVLALYSHYFSVFPALIEVLWLLSVPGIRRRVLTSVGAFALFGLAMAPLALSQASHSANIDWFSNVALPTRIVNTGVTFMVGETGHIIAQPQKSALAILPALLVIASVVLVVVRGGASQRRIGLVLGTVVAGAILIPILGALLGKDYVIERNLMAGLVPLLAIVAVGCSLERARKPGLVLAALLVVGWGAFAIHVVTSPGLQRPNWSGVAKGMGTSTVPRATVTWDIGMDPLIFYLGDGGKTTKARYVTAEKLDVVTTGGVHPSPGRIPFPFTPDGVKREGNLAIYSYSSPVPVQFSGKRLRKMDTGFDTNGLYMDGPQAVSIPANPGPGRAPAGDTSARTE